MSQQQGELAEVLAAWRQSDAEALAQLMPLVFDELRQLARGHFRRESEGHTLQPTALVNEVYMRLVEQRRVQWDNRSQFFAVAAVLTRRILVDHAKARRTDKRGGDVQRLPVKEARVASETPWNVDVLALDEALSALTEIDPRQARVVELRFFAGLTHEEIADLLDVSLSTVKRDWRTARLWLYRRLQESQAVTLVRSEARKLSSLVERGEPQPAEMEWQGIEGAAREAVLAEEMLSSAAVGRRLGAKAENPRELARSLRERSELLGVPSRRGHLYPSFQIDAARQRIRPEVAEVNQLLDAAGDPWGVASWWVSEDGGLGARPMDLVGTEDAERVVEAARALLEETG